MPPPTTDDAALHVRGRVLVGPDEVRDELWVVGGKVTFTAPAGPTRTVQGWVLPGLTDAHCHIGLDAGGAVDEVTTQQQAVTDRDTGVLLVRDAGSPADTRWVQRRDDLPRLVRAGRHIARTRRYLRNYAHEVEPEQLAATVRQEALRGDGWVKIVGDWIDRDLGDLAPCWPHGALEAAIGAAHAAGARVTAHCFGEDCLPGLLEAGIDGIEHATGLTEQTLRLVLEHQVALVPTLVNIATFPRIAERAQERFPVYAAHMRALHARRYATVRTAWEAGAGVYAGSDSGGSLPHGIIAHEVVELVRAGLPATAALSAATWGARAWLGHPGLEEGCPADLVVYPADPREDVGVLLAPELVVLRGQVRPGRAATALG